jgi:hypothetical protein
LTASRKTRRRPFRPDADWRDAVYDHCARILTLAGLLEGSHPLTLAPELVIEAGHMLAQEAEALKALLAQLAKEGR